MKENSVSFGFHFAKQLVNDPSFPVADEVVIVNSSFPGTGFQANEPCVCDGSVVGCTFDTFSQQCMSVNWDPNNTDAGINAHDEAVSVFNNVVNNHDARPLCMLWLQGENDALFQAYQEALFRMFTTFREQFPTGRQQPLPIIIARMAPFYHNTPADLTHQLAATALTNVGVITPNDETIDTVHYSADSHRQMGAQMLDSFKTLSSPVFEEAPTPTPEPPTNESDDTNLMPLWITLTVLLFGVLASVTAHQAIRRKRNRNVRGRLLSEQE
jgi:hypothetical protein